MTPLADALAHTALQYVQLKGVNHVLRDDPTDNVGNHANKAPLSAQLTAALDSSSRSSALLLSVDEFRSGDNRRRWSSAAWSRCAPVVALA